MIIDTHVHYSEAPRPDRPYDPELVKTNPEFTTVKHFSVEDVLADTALPSIDKVVHVTQTKMGYDNRYGLEGAARYPKRILGVVGRFDPLAPGLEARLEAYIAHPFMLAVRFTLMSPITTPWLRNRTLDSFFVAAEKLNVPVQMCAPLQIAEIRDAARRFPGVRFLIDHLALEHAPHRPIDEVFARWPEVLQLAAEPNVWLKVSYFPEAAHVSENFPYPKAQQRFRELYEHVGAQRLVWGSNFPSVTKVCTYAGSFRVRKRALRFSIIGRPRRDTRRKLSHPFRKTLVTGAGRTIDVKSL